MGIIDTFKTQSICACLCGIKLNDEYINFRRSLLNKLLAFFILSKNKFEYGIDEIILKYSLFIDLETCNPIIFSNYISFGIDNSKYVFRRIKKNSYNVHEATIFEVDSLLLDNDTSLLEKNDGSKVVVKDNIGWSSYLLLPDIFVLHLLESRSLYQSLSIKSDLYMKINKNKNKIKLSLFELFSSFDEYNKLILLDMSQPSFLQEYLSHPKINSHFTVVNIDKISIANISLLMKNLISYFSQDFKYCKLKYIIKRVKTKKRRKSNGNSNINSNSYSNSNSNSN